MDMETNKESYYEFSVEWYEDPEVLRMVKKRLISPSAAKTTDTPSLQELQWYENPEIVQNLKKMFGPSLYEDENPEITSFLSRCPQGFEQILVHAPTNEMILCIVLCRNGFAASPLEPRSRHISKMLYNRRFEPLLNEDGKPQGIAFSRHFPKCHEAWPKVKSALKEHGIICRLDVILINLDADTNQVFGYITIKTSKTTDPDIIVKAKQLVHLLSIRIPVNQAIRVLTLSDMHGDIIQLGDEEISGLCSKFGVTQT
ncbi:unnamed protein product [Prunus armeniaca]